MTFVSFCGNHSFIVIQDEEGLHKDENSDGEDHGDIQSGIAKFANDGCNAYKSAFKAIIKKTKGDGTLGPVLSAHLSILLNRSLSKKPAEHQANGQAKKVKHLTFTGVFSRHYDPLDGFTFEINDVSAPISFSVL